MATAKRVRVSDDSGATWHTLPGNTAELSNEAGDLDDTIFGQLFKSTQPGLLQSQVTANGLYKGFAGYVVDIYKQADTSSAMTDQAMNLVSGKTYEVTDATKRIMDIGVATHFEHNSGVTINPTNIESIDYLFGRVTFISSFTPTGSVTATGAYFAKTQLAGSRTFTLTMTADAVDNTTIPSAQGNDGYRGFQQGLKTVSLEIGGVYALSNGFQAALVARERLIIEVNPDGNEKSIARGYYRYTREGQSGNVGALEEETITLALAVPDEDDLLLAPFYWRDASDTTLNVAMQKCMAAWQSGAAIGVQYLWNGTEGYQWSAIVTSMTLTGGLEAMNAFAVTFMNNGAATSVP